MADDPDADLEEIARNFATLWRSLTTGAHGPHDADRREFLVDQVRDALDRAEDRLVGGDRSIIANTFTPEALVGEGMATQVYRGRHRDIGSLHAIKMLRADQAGDPIARRLLMREAKIGMAIRHPNVAATETALRLRDGRPALVFEWLDRSLADLQPDTTLSAGNLTDIMGAILSGLDAIHAAGFVHGDLSPANLLYNGKDLSRLKIADFGVALETGGRHRELDIGFAGRPQFAPPEQLAGEALNARSDLYAAGKILTKLLPRCRENPERFEAFAAELTRERPEERPEDTKAAQHLLDGIMR